MTTSARRRDATDRIRPYVEKAQRFSGWSFADIKTKRRGPEIPWDYQRRAQDLLRSAGSVLDMGTGGGELYARVLGGYGGLAVATESWHPNVRVATNRLRPLGCAVVRSSSFRLPFHDESFSLVLNRHEELDPPEVGRVLARGGRVLTQQVGRRNWEELRTAFPRKQDFGPLFEAYRRGFEMAGLSISRAEEHETRVAYASLGDVVYVLCVAPWEIPGFAPLGKDLDALLEMEQALRTDDGIVLTEDRFLIEAEKR